MSAEADEFEEAETADPAFESMLRKAARIDDVARSPRIKLQPLPGQIIADKYRIDATLGRGGMGAVFRATHLVSQKAVAIKWMLSSIADQQAHARFLREALAAGRIAHPNVVDVYDVGQEEQGAYLVMELLRGETLRERLRRGPLSAAEAIQLLLPALRGVAAAHRAGVIHRDLKPDNIFLCSGCAGEAREAKVLDFGVSAVLAPVTSPTLTSTGTIIGTPAYMSPEQLECATNADERSDVYACGVVLYEALTGVLPFAAKSFAGLALAIVHQPVRPLAELRADIPPAFERVVLRALSKRPEDRYASMDHMIAALVDAEQPQAAASVERSPYVRWLPLSAASLAVLGIAAALCTELSAPGDATNLTHGQGSTPRAALVAPVYPQAVQVAADAPRSAQALAAPASAVATHTLPRSCADALAAGQSSSKNVKIDPDGPGPVRPFEVRCVEVSGEPAREYLPLQAADGSTELNTTFFSYRGGSCPCPDLKRRFTHVRIDPVRLRVDPGDGTLASYDRSLACERQHASQCGETLNLIWGGAGSCRGPGDTTGWASLDLHQTQFALARDVKFVAAGYGASGRASIAHDRRAAQLVGGGQCGTMVADAGSVALVQVR